MSTMIKAFFQNGRWSLFIKTIVCSLRFMYKSSGLLIVSHFILKFVNVTLPFVSAFIMKQILDVLVTSNPKITNIVTLVFFYILNLLAIQLFMTLSGALENILLQKANHQYELDISKAVTKLPMSYIDSSDGHDMLEDVMFVSRTVVSFAFKLIDICAVIYSCIFSFITFAQFGLGYAIVFVLITIPACISDSVSIEKGEDFRREHAPDLRKFSYYGWMLTDRYPAQDIRVYNLADAIKSRYDSEYKKYREANAKIDKRMMYISLLTKGFFHSAEIALTIILVIKAIKGEISIGDITLYISFALSLSGAFSNLVSIFSAWLLWESDDVDVYNEFLNHIPPKKEQKNRKISEFLSLEFKDVYFRYPAGDHDVLAGVSFKINKGEKISLVGINGAGKSTIVKLMLSMYEPDSGQILINGYPIFEYNQDAIHKLFSVLFQDYVRYPLSLRDNVSLSDYNSKDDDEKIKAALIQSGIYNDIEAKLINGIDSFMTRTFDDDGTELSKGQWQKIALSRVYFKNAPIVVFDEPSAALDAEAEEYVFKNFESISSDKTGVIISHRLSASRMADKIIVLDCGKIVETGTHAELIESSGVYAKLYNLQREKYTIEEENDEK